MGGHLECDCLREMMYCVKKGKKKEKELKGSKSSMIAFFLTISKSQSQKLVQSIQLRPLMKQLP